MLELAVLAHALLVLKTAEWGVRDLLRPAAGAHLQLDRARQRLAGALVQQRDRLGRKQLVDHHLRQRPLGLAFEVARRHAGTVGVTQKRTV